MPKVFTNSTKGLVQTSGSGIAFDALDDGIRLKDNGAGGQITLKTKTEALTIADNTTTATTSSGFIPARAIVIASMVSVETASAGGNTVTISDYGLDNDADFFNAHNASIALNTAGGQLGGAPIAADGSLSSFFAAADEVTVTYGDPGTQTTKAVVNVTLWYYDTTATTVATNN